MEKSDEKINKNRRDLQEFAKVINRTILALDRKVNATLMETLMLTRSLTILTNLQFISDTLKQLEHNMIQFREAIDITATGKLSSYLVPPHLFVNILKRIAYNLPEGISLISSIETNTVFLYYTLVQVHALATKQKLRIMIDIPLKSVDRYFELYRVKELPYVDEKSNYSSLGSNVIIPSHPYFAITYNKLYYALLDTSDVARCRGESHTLCPADVVIFSTGQPHCLAALFSGQHTQAWEMCDRRIIGNKR